MALRENKTMILATIEFPIKAPTLWKSNYHSRMNKSHSSITSSTKYDKIHNS